MHSQPSKRNTPTAPRPTLLNVVVCLISLAIAYWFHPASITYILASCVIGALCALLMFARWKYYTHLGSLGFWFAAIAVVTLGNRFALAVAGYDHSVQDDLWVLAQYAATTLLVSFGSLYILQASGRMEA